MGKGFSIAKDTTNGVTTHLPSALVSLQNKMMPKYNFYCENERPATC